MNNVKAEKTFVGYTKGVPTQYGEIVKIGFNEKDIELLKSKLNNSGYTNIVVAKNAKGTWYTAIDEYKPKPESQTQAQAQAPMAPLPTDADGDIDLEEIPF